MPFSIDTQDMRRRFLSYVQVETPSSEENEATPSSECQWDLARILERELAELGLQQVRLDEHCYVYGVLPERLPAGHPRAGKVPAVGFLAHMDVSPAVSSKNVKPILHQPYKGGPIVLPGDPSVVLTPENDPPLAECEGLDLVTSDGTTLLGADDKAGIAILMAMLKALRDHPEIPHGPIHIAFTPDEEIGRGVAKFDLPGFGAEVAYTLDGESLGEVEDETFCADSMTVTFHGVNVHPGFAKNKMINSIKAAAAFVENLPKGACSPETTEKREGYVHPNSITGNEEKTVIKLIIRDFTEQGLVELEKLVEERARAAEQAWPGVRLETQVSHSYRNMKIMIDRRPETTLFAEEAIQAAGVTSVKNPIRGGTDGARLSFMGLPTPNLFTGGHNYHGKKEWVCLQHMEKSAEVCLHLLGIWVAKGEKKGLLPAAS